MKVILTADVDPLGKSGDLKDVANGEKKLPREWINEEGNFVTQEMIDYVKPLMRGEVPVRVSADDGLPLFMRFRREHVEKKLPAYKV